MLCGVQHSVIMADFIIPEAQQPIIVLLCATWRNFLNYVYNTYLHKWTQENIYIPIVESNHKDCTYNMGLKFWKLRDKCLPLIIVCHSTIFYRKSLKSVIYIHVGSLIIQNSGIVNVILLENVPFWNFSSHILLYSNNKPKGLRIHT